MDVSQAIHSKHAVRRFSDQPVPDDVIRETLVALSKMGDYAGHLAGANFAVLLVGSQGELWNGFDWYSFDIGQASSYLQLAAWELGVGSCIATIYKPDEAKALLGVPADRTLSVALSFGYPAADWVNAKMGGRKPLDQVVRWEKW